MSILVLRTKETKIFMVVYSFAVLCFVWVECSTCLFERVSFYCL